MIYFLLFIENRLRMEQEEQERKNRERQEAEQKKNKQKKVPYNLTRKLIFFFLLILRY